jgi:hypothetical protein
VELQSGQLERVVDGALLGPPEKRRIPAEGPIEYVEALATDIEI